MRRMLVAVAVGAVGLVGVTSAWYAGRPLDPMPAGLGVSTSPESGQLIEDEPKPAEDLTVYVTGEVKAPGLVAVPSGSRIADAVAAAGGATDGAVLSALNLAATVSDGMQIVVPNAAGSTSIDFGIAPSGLVNVNAATTEELEALPGVGPVLAARIVAHREAFGAFSSVEDLLDVPGIGEAKLASLREAVSIP